MRYKFLVAFIVCSFFAFKIGHAIDSVSYLIHPTISFVPVFSDSGVAIKSPSSLYCRILDGTGLMNDIEQYKPTRPGSFFFMLLVILLLILSYIKIVFENELNELIQASLVGKSFNHNSLTKSGELSILSFALHVNFVLAISLYVRFFLVYYFPFESREQLSYLLFLFFLFTLFYVTKLLSLELIGIVFELKDLCNEYAYRFSIMCKTLGLALIPVLFILYASPQNKNEILFISSTVFISFMFFLFLWRGLSTGTKLLYSSAYHFFIYVCSMEISMMFLFFKLFTKTII